MRRRLLVAGALAVLPLAAFAQSAGQGGFKIGDRLESKAGPPAGKASRYREIKWDELISPSWNPEAIIKSMNLDMMLDSDPRAIAAMERLRQEWDNAPGNPAIEGAEVKLAGFVVPLEREGNALREFLLVPYFGACIHVPPPPANQTVYVVAKKPAKDTATMDAVWVSGKISQYRTRTRMGAIGYRLDADLVEPYVANKP